MRSCKRVKIWKRGEPRRCRSVPGRKRQRVLLDKLPAVVRYLHLLTVPVEHPDTKRVLGPVELDATEVKETKESESDDEE